MVFGVAPVCVAGCVGWDSTLVLMLLIPHGGSWLCFLASTRELLVSFPPGPLYISKNPLLAWSQYFTPSLVGGWELSHFHALLMMSFSLLCHRLCFLFPGSESDKSLLSLNGINSVVIFCALALSFQCLFAERLIQFSLKWTCVVMQMGGEEGTQKCCGQFAARKNSCFWSAATETMTKISCKSLNFQLDPQCCGLAFETGVWRGKFKYSYISF